MSAKLLSKGDKMELSERAHHAAREAARIRRFA